MLTHHYTVIQLTCYSSLRRAPRAGAQSAGRFGASPGGYRVLLRLSTASECNYVLSYINK